jgi:hypothetical protein
MHGVGMKPETDPITDDEWLIRLVWEDRFTARVPIISPRAFEPRGGKYPDTDGVSLFRYACLNDPTDVLCVIGESKRSRYGIVRIRVNILAGLTLTVRASHIDEVPGHVVIPELNITAYNDNANKAFFTSTMLRLAEEASANILRRPC